MPDSSKTRLGRYELLLPPVGEGSEGLLYKAHCVENGLPGVEPGEPLALKRLRHVGREMRPDRFQRQTELLGRLNHPNIVRHKDSFVWRDEESDEAAEIYCLVTEWLEGQTLKSLIEHSPGGITWDIAEGILTQVLEALVYASAERVVHRDLKPSNIYLVQEPDGRLKVKLIDFGIARPMDAEATTTTTTVSFEGTWHWMAPDFVRLQQDNFRGDEQSDIYSFGVCFYQVLTGKFPYGPTGENPQFAYFQRWLAPTPPKLALHPNLNVLKGARSCIQKCLEVDREKRFRSFEELFEAFRKIKYRQLRHTPELYEYRRYLGQGGFGQVFQGRRQSDGRDVAIKELVAGQHARRFIKEAKILQKAPHPHLVEYLDFLEVQANHIGDESKYFLVLEYLEGMPGSSLRERIRNTPTEMEPREVLILFRGYLDCLEHLHQHPDRVIHRDIKPGNLYAPAGAPEKGKLFDLGIAHEEEGTKTHGQVPGTLDYMPPEFASPDSGRGSPQSDLYSLAVTMYEALTKSLPFPRLPPGEKAWVEYISRSLQKAECTYEHKVFSDHPELAALLRLALAPDPQQRYPTAKAMRDEIQNILDSWDRAAEAYRAAMDSAQAALRHNDVREAEKLARQALECRPGDAAAQQFLQTVEERGRELVARALADGQRACEGKQFAEARQQVELALALQPGDAAAQQLLARIEESERQFYDAAIRAAQLASENKDYTEAQHQAEQALTAKPNDETATQLLTQIRREQERIEAAARLRPPVRTIPIALEMEGESFQSLTLDDPLTAATAEGQTLGARRGDGGLLTRDTTRPSTATAGSKAPPARPRVEAPIRNRRTLWLSAAAVGAVALGAGLTVPFLRHCERKNTGPADNARATAEYVHTRVPQLLGDPRIQADRSLTEALKALPVAASLSERDMAALETSVAHWWTNSTAIAVEPAGLPLAPELTRRIREQYFNRPPHGLSNTLNSLEAFSADRQKAAASLGSLQRDWAAVRQQIHSVLTPWRAYPISTNALQGAIQRDFEQQLREGLGGGEGEWNLDQFARVFGKTREDVSARLGSDYYKPPQKLAALARHKADPKLSAELRGYANEALTSEIAALEATADGPAGASYSTWKTNLERNYQPVDRAQITGLPRSDDIQDVERNLIQLTEAAKQRSKSAEERREVQERSDRLKARLATLRQQVEGIYRASESGLLSSPTLTKLAATRFSELSAIQKEAGLLARPAKTVEAAAQASGEGH